MSQKHEQDREPWLPRIDRTRLFINNAEYERTLRESVQAPDIALSDDGEAADGEEPAPPEAPDPITKPEG